MNTAKTSSEAALSRAGAYVSLYFKLTDYARLFKFRLSLTVVFSSVVGYCLATRGNVLLTDVFWVIIGGFLITAAANAFNQILEKEYDRLMHRTRNRPLAAGRMGMPEALLTAGISAVAGVLILWFTFNMLAAILGALSLFLYAFVYTPLKRLSPIAVLVGGIPGALPPLIGWVCATGTITFEAMLLFSIQFLWQFPHFWAIAWLAYEDYQRAGFKLLPSRAGRDRNTALLSILYILALIGISSLPLLTGMINYVAAAVILAAGIVFLWQSVELYLHCSSKQAKAMMIGSVLYLPVVLIALLAGAV
ncbi:MAG: protoheme IX farnesyltransferase [Chitinophagales bacterium]|nr:MAG: protoheme IX farnesyltransferase [Chitinophagales bacterium]